MGKTILFNIDSQYCFGDPRGSLYVVGDKISGEQSIINTANLVKKRKSKIDEIISTIDSHYEIDISHPGPHRKHDGSPVEPFTVITLEDFNNGKFKGVNKEWHAHIQWYLKQLDQNGRAPLTIWPVHAEIAMQGSNLAFPIQEAYKEWSHHKGKNFHAEPKGINPLTEMYSVLRADVMIPGVKSTGINDSLVKKLIDPEVETILTTGLALNFCLAWSVIDLADIMGGDTSLTSKIKILKDCTAPVPVPGWEKQVESFEKACKDNSIEILNSTDW